MDTPLGPLTLLASPRGLTRVIFGAGASTDSPIVTQARQELAEYFAGRHREFTVPLDWGEASDFRARVQRHLLTIGYGQTSSYGEVAVALGRPGAARAVGSGCRTNPLPIVVPCHRVIRSDGSLGGYAGGLAVKEYLLGLERGTGEPLTIPALDATIVEP
ncbi:methylated-DNA--[protein]-cysteine S-methyltransferase [Corynebacterium sp. zg-331]|uniref:methylated-DNA--[protein]-cysteine S-methyltransferase n=1 Tax=unclassified Corynebacterium TaxID=2624378 RepID=UPI00128DFD75|nr:MULTISPECIES: methylated-DNA--[protein]-cysteine S-methyltransferase [unclassified Corynebacterium]MBC3186657.1 methylated-DNA--[protein]-cysteine S-methyltransferase [Corynebacterium sp. zg-331]MPV53141.1 methylated-DNA--[protein]-cysteine S-methyltransferase [Corynebacterium sp. zg331]